MASSVQTHAAEPAIPSTPQGIESLIESAAAAFETDRNASRQFLYRASALIRARKWGGGPESLGRDPARLPGNLATWQINRVVSYVEEHICEPIQVKDLAARINLSTSYFSRAFKKSVGLTPFGFVTHRRIEHALKLIRTTKQPLSQISAQCGFADQSHLCRLFRRHVGQSPNKWRCANAVVRCQTESQGGI